MGGCWITCAQQREFSRTTSSVTGGRWVLRGLSFSVAPFHSLAWGWQFPACHRGPGGVILGSQETETFVGKLSEDKVLVK